MAEERQEPPVGEKKSLLDEFVSHQRKAAEEACEAVNALIPPDFRTHSKAARDEFIASLRVVVDAAANTMEHELKKMRMSSEGGSSGPSTTGKSKVKVEVS